MPRKKVIKKALYLECSAAVCNFTTKPFHYFAIDWKKCPLCGKRLKKVYSEHTDPNEVQETIKKLPIIVVTF